MEQRGWSVVSIVTGRGERETDRQMDIVYSPVFYISQPRKYSNIYRFNYMHETSLKDIWNGSLKISID